MRTNVVWMVALLAVVAGTACQSRAGSEGLRPITGAGTSSYDPLAIAEPTMPAVPERAPTVEELEGVLRFLADTYTYAARSGFESSLLEVVRSEGLSVLEEDVAEITADGLHADIEPVSLSVLDSTPVEAYSGGWAASFRIRLDRAAGVVADARGRTVRDLRARTFEFEVAVLADGLRFYVADAPVARSGV